MLDPGIAACVRRANELWPARASRATLFGTEGLARVAKDTLVHALLEAAPGTTVEFERFLTAARNALLETAVSAHEPSAADIAALPFYAALTRQCFLNEYIFCCDDSEWAAADGCRIRLLQLLDADAPVPPLLVLAVGAYFPLHGLPRPRRLLAMEQPPAIHAVLRQQVREPRQERALLRGLKRLTPISRGVSENVRSQYEHNPYPRWTSLPIHEQSMPFNSELRRILPLAGFSPLDDDSQPEMLIAGCGTGRESILAACIYRGVRILAVDLSLASIGYAMRKTRELGLTNIEYAQADIVELGDITRTFDIISSVGVLHHLADPFAGWQKLLSRLRPRGFMLLGFYSQLARRHVVKAREFVAARGYTGTVEDIRRFRASVTAGDAPGELQWLSGVADFYSTSECRDLVFHVQEHRLTLDQIAAFLSANGLRFLGFELDPRVLHAYRTRFSEDPAATNLRNWAHFEADHPDTFTAMYQFWVQRSGSD